MPIKISKSVCKHRKKWETEHRPPFRGGGGTLGKLEDIDIDGRADVKYRTRSYEKKKKKKKKRKRKKKKNFNTRVIAVPETRNASHRRNYY
jgi:hypothetical protein